MEAGENGGEVLDPDLVHDLPAMQKALQAFLVRRQRSYRAGVPTKMVRKGEYRNHDSEGWGVRDDEMSTLATLATGLVRRYHKSMEDRIRRCWGAVLDWSGKSVSVEDSR